MNVTLHKPETFVSADIYLPGSKSISNRVLMIHALSGSQLEIENLSDSDDTAHLQKALNTVQNSSSGMIDIGHAGTDMRFLTAYLALKQGSYELTGSERIQQRPVKELVEVLRNLGADIAYKNKEGFPPLLISGKHLTGGKATIRGDISSQFISAVLMIAPYFKDGLELAIEGELVSEPYIMMTIELMKLFGASVFRAGHLISVKAGSYTAIKTYTVESDWSAASYYYSLIALSPIGTSIHVQGLFKNSLQADAACVSIFANFGVDTVFHEKGITMTKTGDQVLAAFNYDFTHCPDIAQTLVCTCVGLNIPFHFTGLKTLKLKETDRIHALKNEWQKFGVLLHTSNNSISFEKRDMPINQQPVIISTYNDHRMAMSFAPIALLTNYLEIEDAEVVSKSYPGFWEDLQKTGIILKP